MVGKNEPQRRKYKEETTGISASLCGKVRERRGVGVEVHPQSDMACHMMEVQAPVSKRWQLYHKRGAVPVNNKGKDLTKCKKAAVGPLL